MNKKLTAEKKLYLELETDERKRLKEIENKRVITDPIEIQKHLHSLFEAEEQSQKFDENRAAEVLIYRKNVVEAKTPEQLRTIESLILNRISILDEIPELKETRKKLKGVLKYCQSELSTIVAIQPGIQIPSLNDNGDLKNMAQEWLNVLAGNWNGKKIMTNEDYKKVIEGILKLVDSGQVSPIDKKIQINAPGEFIRKLFRELNRKIQGKPINDNFIVFLKTHFECFENYEFNTIKGSFNQYSKNFIKDYDKVKATIN